MAHRKAAFKRKGDPKSHMAKGKMRAHHESGGNAASVAEHHPEGATEPDHAGGLQEEGGENWGHVPTSDDATEHDEQDLATCPGCGMAFNDETGEQLSESHPQHPLNKVKHKGRAGDTGSKVGDTQTMGRDET